MHTRILPYDEVTSYTPEELSAASQYYLYEVDAGRETPYEDQLFQSKRVLDDLAKATGGNTEVVKQIYEYGMYNDFAEPLATLDIELEQTERTAIHAALADLLRITPDVAHLFPVELHEQVTRAYGETIASSLY